MSGHSKWSTIKRKKSKVDAQRGRIFTKLIRELLVAARYGTDPETNSRLRQAIMAAKAENMPKDNIERAIKKGSGEMGGEIYEECIFEGYGPGSVAVLVHTLTDNRKRTSQEIRHLFSKHGGKMGEAGCVGWMFTRKGYFGFSSQEVELDKLMEVAIEFGAEDVREEGDIIEVITEPQDFERLKKAFEEKNLKWATAEITMTPQTNVKLSGKEAEQMLKLMEALEELDDVQKVYANFDISTEEMEKMVG